MSNYFEYRLADSKYNLNVSKKSRSVTFFYPGFSYNESTPYIVSIPPGKYTIECWGSQGFPKEYGAYTSGDLLLSQTLTLYLYLGSFCNEYRKSYTLSFNGGGCGDRAGGGATDVRLLGGDWDNFISLKTRIMVAGGSGGNDNGQNGGYGGELTGITTEGHANNGNGGTQTTGGIGYVSGAFGIGGSDLNITNGVRQDTSSGGGSGYYGGSTGKSSICCAGGGGSSFISGHKNCDAINESSTQYHIVHTHQEKHYSGIYFTNTKMIAGGITMPLPTGNDGIGYLGEGVVRITSEFIIPYRRCTLKRNLNNFHFFLPLVLINLLVK